MLEFSSVAHLAHAGWQSFGVRCGVRSPAIVRRAATHPILLALALLVAGNPHAVAQYVPGIDISHYQGTINWSQVASDPKGIKFAFMKATEDTYYTDSTFNTNLAGAKAAGVLAGPYHFCRLESGSSDPAADAVAEANYFLSKIKPKYLANTYLPPVADIESWPTGLTTSALKTLTTTWTNSFSTTIYNALGVRPLVYTSQSKATSLFDSSATNNPLWVAAWKTNGTASPPANVLPWRGWTFWQWTDDAPAYPSDGPITGFGSGVRVDRDVFNGTLAQLQAMLVGKDVNAKPGDFNRDGLVNAADYNVWKTNNGKIVPLYSGADANGDARVNDADFAVWQAAVPEPSSMTLISGALIVSAASSRRSRLARR